MPNPSGDESRHHPFDAAAGQWGNCSSTREPLLVGLVQLARLLFDASRLECGSRRCPRCLLPSGSAIRTSVGEPFDADGWRALVNEDDAAMGAWLHAGYEELGLVAPVAALFVR